MEHIEEFYAGRDDIFANTHLVRDYLETSIMNQTDRLFGRVNLTDTELCMIEIENVHNIA